MDSKEDVPVKVTVDQGRTTRICAQPKYKPVTVVELNAYTVAAPVSDPAVPAGTHFLVRRYQACRFGRPDPRADGSFSAPLPRSMPIPRTR